MNKKLSANHGLWVASGSDPHHLARLGELVPRPPVKEVNPARVNRPASGAQR
ncbi:hypothetical protein AAB988_28170 [Burkholderia contaminans]|uniref:hypothetical protein n=1 Tax=Burkholderia contaminans TaxID=488447 RepID=UPI0031185388